MLRQQDPQGEALRTEAAKKLQNPPFGCSAFKVCPKIATLAAGRGSAGRYPILQKGKPRPEGDRGFEDGRRGYLRGCSLITCIPFLNVNR
jgi:hypothetical protein